MKLPVVYTIQRYMKAALILVSVLVCATTARAGLLYSALRQDTWNIYFQANLTSEPEIVTETIAGDKNASALSPNGRSIAFEVQCIGIYVCLIGSLSKCLLIRPKGGTAVRPTWHPVTGKLLFVRYLADGTKEDADIFVTRNSLTEMDMLIEQTGIQDYPDVSPDGRLLAYTSSHTISVHRSGVQVVQQLWIMNLETGVARQLILGNAQDIQPDWSPSGQQIAFASNRNGQFDIWVVNADGKDLRQITSGSGAKTWPAWSPGGKSIMFTLLKNGNYSLWIINVDGTNLRSFEPFGSGAKIELRDADWR